ncbi:hypothetical protein BDF20DRAFT_832052 [Mycotypha africana]|uniref:uncharacterized protein n=1 Tax=Mycotypha africana TaxID=64632 RepID=UPI002300973D|nr:uncharacterized protein BDF20DRAFT_832052 [Mycotypha africana]KAI8992067.1 hypothetical protein BDF20DRAFT_832052 [Mycotypha africana]
MSISKPTITTATTIAIESASTTAFVGATGIKEELQQSQAPTLLDQHYSEDEDTATDTGRTFSTLAEPAAPLLHTTFQHHQDEEEEEEEETPFMYFKNIMKDAQNSNRVSRYQNTYFMDGGHRFISLPTLGSSSKAASHISRIFEDWLQAKLYHQNTILYDGILDDRLPILEDSVELIAEDIINKLKSRSSIRGLAGLSRIYMKIRTGHVYTYHQSDDGQPLITADMEDFFQQFPLFVEIIIDIMPRDYSSQRFTGCDDVEVLLSLENITINPSEPYYIKESIPLIV